MGSEESPFSTMMKAREKNALEDLKLHRLMTLLDVERRHFDKLMYNDIFEQKQIAYKLKQEVKDMKSRSAEEVKRKQAKKRTRKKRTGVVVAPAIQEPAVAAPSATSLPLIKQDKSKLKDVSSRLVNAFQDMREKTTSWPTLPTIQDDDEETASPVAKETTATTKTVPLLKTPCASARTALQAAAATATAEDEVDSHQPQLPVLSDQAYLDRLPEEKTKVRFASIVQRLVQERRSSLTEEKSKWNDVFSRLFPKRPPIVKQQSQDRGREGNDVPAGEEEDELGNPLEGETVVVLGDLWVGDPKAIGSVRRARRSPEELCNRENSIGEVRKLIRDMPQYPLCSRNCNRPGAALDSIAQSMPVYNLPALAKAQIKRSKLFSVNDLNLDEDIADVDKLPTLDINYANEKGQNLVKTATEKHRDLFRTTRMLNAKLDRVRGGVKLQTAKQVVKVGNTSRIQISYTFGATKLGPKVM